VPVLHQQVSRPSPVHTVQHFALARPRKTVNRRAILNQTVRQSSFIQRVAIHFSPSSTTSAAWIELDSSWPSVRFDLADQQDQQQPWFNMWAVRMSRTSHK